VHTRAVEDVYHRMLRAADAHGRFVPRPSGRRVHVVTGGDGPSLVHLHGTNTSSLSHLMLPGRTPDVRSYLVDRPGCGLSDAEPFRRERFREHAVSFVGDVLDALGIDTTILVGASGGGIWATWYALSHPDRVRGLVMLGSVPTLPGGRTPVPLRLAATPGVGDVMVRAMRPGRRMVRAMMASVGEADTIDRHPDLLDSLVAGARDPVASRANLDELRALISPRGFRAAMRLGPDDLSPTDGAHPDDLGRSRSRRAVGAGACSSSPDALGTTRGAARRARAAAGSP
jgi:pimeloyl-ACP methyl ester carboxylesterase